MEKTEASLAQDFSEKNRFPHPKNLKKKLVKNKDFKPKCTNMMSRCKLWFFPVFVCSIAGLPGPGSGLKARIKYLKGPSRSRRSRCRSSGVTLASKMLGF